MPHDMGGHWKPTASIDALRLRCRLLNRIRLFFEDRGVLEVETPLLSAATVTDPHLSSMSSRYKGPGAPDGRKLFLRTSPEYAMKRLLAAGSGPIYQICKAFRDGESGRHHNPEFTLLEWYRPGFDHHQLMDEMDDFLHEILHTEPAERMSYEDMFQRFVGVNPHDASAETLIERAHDLGLKEVENLETNDRDDWLHLLMIHAIEPHIGRSKPTFVYDYPVSQSALARIRPGNPSVAERFEVYLGGVELANGFHELTDADEQRSRFVADLEKREALGLEPVPMDGRILAALEAGMPSSAGVALGVDRLVALAAGTKGISDVVAFSIDRA